MSHALKAPVPAARGPSPPARPQAEGGGATPNRRWSRLLTVAGTLQAKLTVNAPGDAYEQEADRVADQVLRMPDGELAGVAPAAPGIQRMCAECEEEKVQAKEAPGAVPAVAPETEAKIGALRGGGAPLSPDLRGYFEPRLGQDLSAVRLHTGGTAQAAAGEVQARAFTVGPDIAFGRGELRPETESGKQLLAHELVHTVQQGQGRPGGALQRTPAPPKLNYTALAEQIYDAIDGPGTDEEAVYRALQQLNRNGLAIDELKKTYKKEHDLDLIDDIHGDFSEGELEYALQLLSAGSEKAPERVLTGPNALLGVAAAIERLRAAVEIAGTEEEVIFAVLLPYSRNTEELETAYEKRYGENLRNRFREEMEGSELDYALGLLSPPRQHRKAAQWLDPYFIETHFAEKDRPLARRILADLLEVRNDHLDFADEAELKAEIQKRLSASQLMQQSQLGGAFGYPESTPSTCPGFDTTNYLKNARVNAEAKLLWTGPHVEGMGPYYYFLLSPDGLLDPYKALVALFKDQGDKECDKTRIHCDSLVTVIQFRAYADSLGVEKFNQLVRSGQLEMVLSWNGFRTPGNDYPHSQVKSPIHWSMQEIRPASENDLVIGDHVTFWNHLAYDGIVAGAKMGAPWRNENALLVDKRLNGEDLFLGHGAPEVAPNKVAPGNRDQVLAELVGAFNPWVEAALALTGRLDRGPDPEADEQLRNEYPRVGKLAGEGWVIHEPNSGRKRRFYPLRPLSGPRDPDVIGLRDPDDPSKMGKVKRPVESAKGPAPKKAP